MDQCQSVVVVHGSGQNLNRLCEDIMQSSQWLLDALGSQGWNAAVIEGQLDLMSSMIEERYEYFKGVCLVDFLEWGEGARWI
jgi:hypothetical protein